VFVRVARIGRTSVTYLYAAHRIEEGAEDVLLVTASQTLVLIDHGTRATMPVPERFRREVSGFEQTTL
jgi:acyl-CoA thioesterase FadM